MIDAPGLLAASSPGTGTGSSVTRSGVPSRARAALRDATDPVHRRLHRHPAFAAVAAGRIEPLAYRRLLARCYGFYEPIERLVVPGLAATACLVGDLRDLGMAHHRIASLPRCEPPPLDWSAAERIGAAYVLKGASLGGAVLARALAGRSPGPALPARFFAGDGGAGWRCLLGGLDQALPDAPRRAAAGRAAVATFLAFEAWMAGWADGDE